jgi:hypothetical protein
VQLASSLHPDRVHPCPALDVPARVRCRPGGGKEADGVFNQPVPGMPLMWSHPPPSQDRRRHPRYHPWARRASKTGWALLLERALALAFSSVPTCSLGPPCAPVTSSSRSSRPSSLPDVSSLKRARPFSPCSLSSPSTLPSSLSSPLSPPDRLRLRSRHHSTPPRSHRHGALPAAAATPSRRALPVRCPRWPSRSARPYGPPESPCPLQSV